MPPGSTASRRPPRTDPLYSEPEDQPRPQPDVPFVRPAEGVGRLGCHPDVPPQEIADVGGGGRITEVGLVGIDPVEEAGGVPAGSPTRISRDCAIRAGTRSTAAASASSPTAPGTTASSTPARSSSTTTGRSPRWFGSNPTVTTGSCSTSPQTRRASNRSPAHRTRTTSAHTWWTPPHPSPAR